MHQTQYWHCVEEGEKSSLTIFVRDCRQFPLGRVLQKCDQIRPTITKSVLNLLYDDQLSSHLLEKGGDDFTSIHWGERQATAPSVSTSLYGSNYSLPHCMIRRSVENLIQCNTLIAG